VDIATRRDELTATGWRGFDPKAPDPTADEISRHRGKRGTGPA
jgi:hypothetical protein